MQNMIVGDHSTNYQENNVFVLQKAFKGCMDTYKITAVFIF